MLNLYFPTSSPNNDTMEGLSLLPFHRCRNSETCSCWFWPHWEAWPRLLTACRAQCWMRLPKAPRSQPDGPDPFLGGHLGLLSRWSPYKMPSFGGPAMAPFPHLLAQGANTLKVPDRSDCPSLVSPQPQHLCSQLILFCPSLAPETSGSLATRVRASTQFHPVISGGKSADSSWERFSSLIQKPAGNNMKCVSSLANLP